jgi:hypothetical protein
MSTIAQRELIVERGAYLTDGCGLYWVVDLVDGEGVVLEDACTRELTWHGLEELLEPAMRGVTPESETDLAPDTSCTSHGLFGRPAGAVGSSVKGTLEAATRP